MSKEKIKEHGVEYILLNDKEDELWEIDYDKGHAINVSEYVKLDLLNYDDIIRYSGTIEDFLINERACKNVHFHETMGVPAHLHVEACSFDAHD
jgi:hypothetical protein